MAVAISCMLVEAIGNFVALIEVIHQTLCIVIHKIISLRTFTSTYMCLHACYAIHACSGNSTYMTLPLCLLIILLERV